MMKNYPRVLDPAQVFDALVQWFYDDLLVKKKAPGFAVGLSGTDSLVVFCAAAEALKKAGKLDHLMGVHFAPSEDFLYDHPEAEEHTWFRDNIMPWLAEKYPQAKLVVDTSIDWRYDGRRWGALMDMSVVSENKRRVMRPAEDQHWVLGTRNRSEEVLMHYSNASLAVSVQPIIHLWKHELLELSEYLGFPQIAITKSCETDCICGRLQLSANHIKETGLLLMARCGELSNEYIEKNIPSDLRIRLNAFIEAEIKKNSFKERIPYMPPASITSYSNNPLVRAFEDGTLNIREFNHYKHLEIAWYYLKDYSIEGAVSQYSYHLVSLLSAAGYVKKFNLDITTKYFERLERAMEQYPTGTFQELVEKYPAILEKNSA